MVFRNWNKNRGCLFCKMMSGESQIQNWLYGVISTTECDYNKEWIEKYWKEMHQQVNSGASGGWDSFLLIFIFFFKSINSYYYQSKNMTQI